MLKTKLSEKNKITCMAVNIWAVAIIVRHSVCVEEWRSDERKELDRKTRKEMTMHGALHPKSDGDQVQSAKTERRKKIDQL